MTITKTKKQPKAQRLKAAYESMSDERKKAIDSQLNEIGSDYEIFLQDTGDEAAQNVVDEFDRLLTEGYPEDEIEAVLRKKRYGFDHYAHETLKGVWTHWWLPEKKYRMRSAREQNRTVKVPANNKRRGKDENNGR